MPRPLHKLRAKMYEYDYTSYDIAIAINRSPAYISTRLNKKLDWSLNECIKIAEVLKIPNEKKAEYFI